MTEPNSITSSENGAPTISSTHNNPGATITTSRRSSQSVNVPTTTATSNNAIIALPSNNIVANGNNNNNNSITSTNNNILAGGDPPTHLTNNNNNNNNRIGDVTKATNQNPLYNGSSKVYPQNNYDTALNRRSPEGEDSERYAVESSQKIAMNNNLQKGGGVSSEMSTGIFQASNENGKINVQVTVLVGKFYEL